MSTWKATTLGEIVELQRGFDLPEYKRRPGHVPVIGSAGPTGWHDTALVNGPGIVVGRAGASAGVVTYVCEPFWPHNATLFVKNFKGNDPRFLYYFLQTLPFRDLNSGAAQPMLNRNYAYSLPVRVPHVTIQRRIASILGAYDDLIEVNRRRIGLLEEVARRLFEEWFVHFRFPGHGDQLIVDTPSGPVPKDWRWEELGALCTEIRDSVSPADVEADTPYVGLEHIPRRSTTLDAWGRADEVISTKLRFRAADVLFGKIRPYFHKVVFAPFDGVSSSDAIIIRSRTSDLTGLVLSVVSSDSFVAHAVATSNGTKMPRANWGVLVHYPVPIAPDEVMKPFNDAVVTRAALAASLNGANVRLAASRDLLLPRLISGELSAGAAEQELEAVA
jgi:type I restriction enzyme S subunit